MRRANEKGGVEGVVKYARLNFLVPVPQVSGLEELNRNLAEACREDLKRRLRGKSATKAQLLTEDREAFLPHPAGGFDACRKVPTRANSLSLTRFDRNDYYVPESKPIPMSMGATSENPHRNASVAAGEAQGKQQRWGTGEPQEKGMEGLSQ